MGDPRRVDDRYYDHLATVLRRVVDEQCGGNQTKAQEALGISQSHLSQLLKGSKADRRIGLASLMQLREATGISLDELLGLAPADATVLARRVARLEERFREMESDPLPSARPKGRRRKEA